MKTNGVLP